ncbi:MAG: SRPBCC domain-containing protein [Bacteroidetes bacterium]|nr:SRPBCC domain-containing protein [Bacteroidota bacterium]
MKLQFELEYQLNCSPKVLFPRISTPEGLAEWFADEVTVEGDIFSFIWNKTALKAKLVNLRENRLARFEWSGREKERNAGYFEFRINVEELTGDVALIITDFAEPEEKEDSIYLWDTEVQKLKSILGSS